MKRILAVLALALAPTTMQAQVLAFNPTGLTYDVLNGYSIGYQFVVDQPFWVTQLGYFDLGGDGLAMAHEVGLFSTSAPFVTAIVPAGTAAPLVNGYRMVDITPVLLQGQSYWIGAQSDGDAFGQGIDANYGGTATVTGADGLRYDSAGFCSNTTSLQLPICQPSAYNINHRAGYFGPNFTVVSAVPEPATLALVGTGLIGLFGVRRRYS